MSEWKNREGKEFNMNPIQDNMEPPQDIELNQDAKRSK